MRDLAGKVAVVTGGTSGIGLAMARRFAAEGIKVAQATGASERAPASERPQAACVAAERHDDLRGRGTP